MSNSWRGPSNPNENWRANNDNWRSNSQNRQSNETPVPPQDSEIRLSIEKTAHSCALHGPQFEAMMKDKQRNNPNFAFLNGGMYSDYYQYMLRVNIQQLQASSQQYPSTAPPPNLHNSAPGQSTMFPPPPQLSQSSRQSLPSLMDTPEINEIKTKIEEMRQKISDSENNLKAHKVGLEDILQAHWKSTIRTSETQKVEQLMLAQNLNSTDLSGMLESLSNSKCSKDTISNVKKWIFENCYTDQLREIILTYLLNIMKDESSSDYLRLHILYLINDWAYHCQRKKEENQLKMLARYVPKMFAYCMELSKSYELRDKLEGKLLGEWEGRGYFVDSVFKQMRNTSQIVNTDRDMEMMTYGQARESIRANLMATYEGYEQQHNTYANHIKTQIEELERKVEELRYGPLKRPTPQSLPHSRRSRFDQTPQERQHSSGAKWTEETEELDGDDIDGHPFDETSLKPMKSYMSLPAGIMIPLVGIKDFEYEALDPEKLEMPPLVPPSQRLLAAKEAFYKMLHVDSVVNNDVLSDDWDITNYPMEFFEKKAQAKKRWLEDLADDGASEEDVIRNKPTGEEKELLEKEEKRKFDEMISNINSKVDEYYADDEQPQNHEEPSKNPSPPPPERSKSRSRSRSPSREKRRSRRSRSSSSSSDSDSDSSDSSDSSKSSGGSSRRRRSNSRSPRRTKFNRSPSPEYNAHIGFQSTNVPLSEDNKGAQLMAKMGWTSGRGLGANESGIINPVDGGEVRDKMEQFRGLGSSLDPYEQFRKQRAGSYRDRGSSFRRGF